MASIGKIVRRTFLFGAVAVAGVAAFGVWQVRRDAPNPLEPGPDQASLNPFLMIGPEGVTIVTPRAEMGQGAQTTLAALVAEEMDLDWEQVRVMHGPPARAYYNAAALAEGLPNKGYDATALQESLGEMMGSLGKPFEMQITGGSTSMKDGFERMRIAGAAAREALKLAAAERLGVAARDLATGGGQVIAPDGTATPYAELAIAATDHEPRNVILRDRSDWRLLGTALPRLDTVAKSTGTETYSTDIRLPGMRYAAIRRAPHRGQMAGYEDRAARRMAGVEKVVDIGDGVAVIASNSWLAQQAAQSVEIEWGAPGDLPADDAAVFAALEAAFDAEPNSTLRDEGDVAAPLPEGAETLEAEYRVPFLAHATMEPMSATAWIDGPRLRVWCGNQAPLFMRDACAEEAGLAPEDVELTTLAMGGGFGRRGELDFGVIATRIAKAVPGTPVSVTWTREEDMTHDWYRPAAIGRMRGAVHEGRARMIDAVVSAPSITQQTLERWTGFSPGGPDKVHVEGLFNQPYAVPDYRARGFLADIAPPLGFWRAVGNTVNGFVHESFIDEMAHAAGADPLRFRMEMAKDEWEPALNVLEAAGALSDWDNKPEGTGRGIAFVYSYGTPVAMVIDVTRGEDGLLRIPRAFIVADPGTALDPGIIEAQLTGGMVYGLSAAIGEEITFDKHRVQQRNFPDYEPLRITQMPEVSVRILQAQDRLGGIGEVGTPPAAPALANALFDLTGERVRDLPLRKHFDFYA